MGKAAQSKEGEGGSSLAWRKWRDGLVSPAGSVSSRQSATGARSPLGTRFWSGCGRAQPGAEKGSVSSGSHRKSQRGRCWFGAASYFWRRIVYRLPLLPSKEKHLRQEDGQADQDHGRVGPGSVQLRHRVEIHAVPPGDEGEGHKNRGHHREELHHPVLL